MYRLAKSHSNKMAKAGRLFHSNRLALLGGENICGGEGHLGPRDFVNSWMKSSRHRAWLLDYRVKAAAVGISNSRYGTYAAWSFTAQPLEYSKKMHLRRKRRVAMGRKIIGWFLFTLGVINILSLLAMALIDWLGGLYTGWPFTLVFSLFLLWAGWKIAHPKPKY